MCTYQAVLESEIAMDGISIIVIKPVFTRYLGDSLCTSSTYCHNEEKKIEQLPNEFDQFNVYNNSHLLCKYRHKQPSIFSCSSGK